MILKSLRFHQPVWSFFLLLFLTPKLIGQAANTFVATGTMTIPRNFPAAATLDNGKVLIVGGSGNPAAASSAELYDPTSGTFQTVGPLHFPRLGGLTATTIAGGKVLINGGQDNLSAPFPAEIYDSSTATFTLAGIPTVARSNGATATLLPDGNVLFVGGQLRADNNVPAEIFDVKSGTFRITAGAQNVARVLHAAAPLANGEVLLVGGFAFTDNVLAVTSSSEIYDPTNDRFVLAGSIGIPSAGPGLSAATLLSGVVLVTETGGQAELFNPQTQLFTPTTGAGLGSSFVEHATALRDGNVLLTGAGKGVVYDASSQQFLLPIKMQANRLSSAVAPLANGNVLVAGGFDLGSSTTLASAEIFTSVLKPLVLIVPGTLATKLAHCSSPSCAETDRTVWFTDATIAGPAELDELKYDSIGNPVAALTPFGHFADILNVFDNADDPNNHLTCSGTVLEVYSALSDPSRCIRSINTYNDLITTLKGAGYGVERFPYDWRLDIATLSEQLFVKVQELHQSKGLPIAIIAHSAGGLIVGELLRVHRPELVNQLGPIVTLGTPFNGAVVTYMKFQGWDRLTPFVNALKTQAVGSNWTMAYELLPRFDFLTLPNGSVAPFKDLYSGVFSPLYPALPRNGNALPLAFSFWKASEANTTVYESAYAVIGSGRPTPRTIGDDSKLSECNPTVGYANGDETVPLNSAQASTWIPPSNFRYIGEQHELLASNPVVMGAILRILSGAAPDNLSSKEIDATAQHWKALGCSPVDLIATDSSGAATSETLSQIDEGQYYSVGGHKQIIIPEDTSNTIHLLGSGTGKFNIEITQVQPDGAVTQVETFQDVPVTPVSRGTITLQPDALGNLQYDYTGSGSIDVIPANVKPPTILCSACSFEHNEITFSFDVGFRGAVSTFSATFQEGHSIRTADFRSTTVSDIFVSGGEVTFSGEGLLDGAVGFTFLIHAFVNSEDGHDNSPGNVSIDINGPNHLTIHRSGRINTGSLTIHQ